MEKKDGKEKFLGGVMSELSLLNNKNEISV
jgi:hypothetical protein